MSDKSPILYLIGGPNGAGKTTFAKQFLPAVGVMEFLNADSLAAGLSPLDPPLAATRAARLLLSRWKENSNSTHLAIMNPSAPADHQSDSSDRFFKEAQAAMLRASRQVAAENRRLGLPLVVERPRHKRPARKRLVKGAALLQF